MSYYSNTYSIMNRPLIDVIHNNRYMFDYSISNSVLVFTWEEKVDYYFFGVTHKFMASPLDKCVPSTRTTVVPRFENKMSVLHHQLNFKQCLQF